MCIRAGTSLCKSKSRKQIFIMGERYSVGIQYVSKCVKMNQCTLGCYLIRTYKIVKFLSPRKSVGTTSSPKRAVFLRPTAVLSLYACASGSVVKTALVPLCEMSDAHSSQDIHKPPRTNRITDAEKCSKQPKARSILDSIDGSRSATHKYTPLERTTATHA